MAGMHNIPLGFRLNGTASGLKKNGMKDLALFYSETPCSSAAVFTKNLVRAAPVVLSEKNTGKSGTRAVIANSGCANACTGKKGYRDAEEMCRTTASCLGIPPSGVLVASTGVIGQFLDMKKINSGIHRLCRNIRRPDKRAACNAARAIMTTDTVEKTSCAEFGSGKRKIRIWACAKGAGMIHPDMATFLCFILTDCRIAPGPLKRILSKTVDNTFNLMSVDGVTSTNDTVFILANGLAGNRAIRPGTPEYRRFSAALEKVCSELAEKVVSDGEGATKFVRIKVRRASTRGAAEKAAKTVAVSPLVKTAMFGEDANWGRILAGIGSCGARIDPSRVSIYFRGLCVFRKGKPAVYQESRASRILKNRTVDLIIDLGRGKHSLTYYACDMGYGYIKINADYRT